MSLWQRWAFNALSAVVIATGLVYFWMKYLLTPEDPLAVVNHPLQPLMIDLHILSGPALLVIFGIVFHAHIASALARRVPLRRSGLAALVTFGVMAASAYLLQVVVDEHVRLVLLWLHIGGGLVFAASHTVHVVGGSRLRRRSLLLVSVSLVAIGGIRSAADGPRAIPHWREAFVMGTRVTLTTYAETRSRGRDRLEQMLEVIERTEAELSTWRPDSAVSRLNAAAGRPPQHLTAQMCRLFSDLGQHVAETGGAFDPAIGSFVAAWDLHGRGRVPSERELDIARAQSGWRHTSLDVERCTMRLPAGMSIDVGAFGKGEALDRVRAEASADGAWLIDLGGQLAVSGVPPGEDGWLVTVAHPRIRTQPVMSLKMTGGSLSTSAGSERDLHVHGMRVGHILDPGTGAPAPFDGSVSVWSDRALVADVVSTALYVMGPDTGNRWADAHDVAAVFLTVGADGTLQQRRSRAFSRRFADAAPHPSN